MWKTKIKCKEVEPTGVKIWQDLVYKLALYGICNFI